MTGRVVETVVLGDRNHAQDRARLLRQNQEATGTMTEEHVQGLGLVRQNQRVNQNWWITRGFSMKCGQKLFDYELLPIIFPTGLLI